jgi:hypothetical protein
LVVLGRFDRNLFGMAMFAAISLLVCGAYLLCGALLDPLGAIDVAVVVAGFALALASFVLAFLVWSKSKEILARRREENHELELAFGPVLTVQGQTLQDEAEGEAPGIEPAAVATQPVSQAWAARAGK